MPEFGADKAQSADTELPVAAALADNTANPTTTSVASFGMVYDGSTWDRQLGDSTNGTLVNLGSNNDVSLNAGTNLIGKVSIDQVTANANEVVTKTGSVTTATLGAGSALAGDVGISGARTSGGTTPYKNLDVDETEDEVKGTAGQIFWIHAVNLSAAKLYLKIYNAAAADVTVGTTVPTLTLPVPTLATTNGNGFVFCVPNGIAFSTAITIAATTGFADNDAGAPGANELIVNLGYA